MAVHAERQKGAGVTFPWGAAMHPSHYDFYRSFGMMTFGISKIPRLGTRRARILLTGTADNYNKKQERNNGYKRASSCESRRFFCANNNIK